MKRFIPLVAFGAFLTVCSAQAQLQPAQLDIDYATFLYDDSKSLLELYLSVSAESLDFDAEDGRFLATLPLDISLSPVSDGAPDDVNAEPVLNETLTLRFALADTTEIEPGQFFVEQFRTAVTPGEYTLLLTIPTRDDRPEIKLVMDATVPSYGTSDHAVSSGVTLATNIRQAVADEVDHPLTKNGLMLTPNPNGLFGEAQPRVFYYLETYGLEDAVEGDEYTLLAYISPSSLLQAIPGYQRRTSRSVRNPDVLIGMFDIAELPSGSYFLRFAVLNANNEAIVEQSKKFLVFNPNVELPVAAVDAGFETSLYAVMSIEEVDLNLDHAKVIGTQTERSQIGNLSSLEAKQNFLARFWTARDTDTDPSVNSARREFYERLRYAEERYRAPGEEVYRTDRGRVLLVYGYPSNVDPRPFDGELVPHEIWSYENIPGQGQALFVFADRQGIGRYDLVHSTVSGETSLPNWREMLVR